MCAKYAQELRKLIADLEAKKATIAPLTHIAAADFKQRLHEAVLLCEGLHAKIMLHMRHRSVHAVHASAWAELQAISGRVPASLQFK